MAKALRRGGFPSIFHDKRGGSRYQGVLTKVGSKEFEAARKALGDVAKKPARKVTDADVMEALARGWENACHYIQFGPEEGDKKLKEDR